jgi:hypothetical protein
MKKIRIYILFIACAVTLTGCGEKDNGPGITSLELTLSKQKVVGDNSDFAIVSVIDQAGRNVNQYVTVRANGEKVTGDMIISSTPSFLTVYAEYNTIKSNEVQLVIVEDKNLKFEKNVLIEQYTGTWCGWCPRAINEINILETTDKKIVHSAMHLSDGFAFSWNSNLFQSFGFTGIPTVHADRTTVWSGSASELTSLHAPSRIGISLEVTGNKNDITAAVKVKFGYQFPDGLKLSVYLLHDNLVADQTNYYNTNPSSPYYQMGSPMVDFIHRNVLLKSGTNMFGDAIPADSIDIGRIYPKNIYFSNFRCDNINMMRVIAIVTYQDGKQAGIVGNCVKASVGEKKDFVYSTK